MPVAGGVKSILFFRNDMPATSDIRDNPGVGRETKNSQIVVDSKSFAT